MERSCYVRMSYVGKCYAVINNQALLREFIMKLKSCLGIIVASMAANISVVWSAYAQHHAHIHSEGQLLIAQDDNAWRFEFVLPAADMLGFEHAPQTQAEVDTVKRLIKDAERVTLFLVLPKQCKITQVTHQLRDKLTHLSDEPYEHDHTKHHQDEHEHEHEHEHSDKVSHTDVTIAYEMECRSPIKSADIQLFSLASSLTKLQVQWITDASQGALILTPNATEVRL